MSMSASLLAARDWRAVRSSTMSAGPMPVLWEGSKLFALAYSCAPSEIADVADKALLDRVAGSLVWYDHFVEEELDPAAPGAGWRPISGLSACFRLSALKLRDIVAWEECILETCYSRRVPQRRARFWSRRRPPSRRVDSAAWTRDLPFLQDEVEALASVLDRLEAEGETGVRLVTE